MPYRVVYSARKTLSLEVGQKGVIVRAPFGVGKRTIDNFVSAHRTWLERALKRQQKRAERYSLSDEQIQTLRQTAEALLPKRVAYYEQLTGLRAEGIKITAAKTRFGSCNAKNSLCFSLYLMTYDLRAVDYVVLHELAHTVHKNHGRAFYALIERYMPDYKCRVALLQDKGLCKNDKERAESNFENKR